MNKLLHSQEMSDQKQNVHGERVSWSNLPSVLLAFSLSWLTNDVQSLARTTSTCKRWLTDHRVDRLFEQALKRKLSDRGDPMSIVEQPALAGADGKASWRTRCARYCQALLNFWKPCRQSQSFPSTVSAFHLERASDILWLGHLDGLMEARDLNTGKQIFQFRASAVPTCIVEVAANDERTVLVTSSGCGVSVWQYMSDKLLFKVALRGGPRSIDFWKDRYLLLCSDAVCLYSLSTGNKLGEHFASWIERTDTPPWASPFAPARRRHFRHVAQAVFQSERQIMFRTETNDNGPELFFAFSIDVSESGELGVPKQLPLESLSLDHGYFLESSARCHVLVGKRCFSARRKYADHDVLAADRTGVLVVRTNRFKMRAVQLNDKNERSRQVTVFKEFRLPLAQRNWRFVVGCDLIKLPSSPGSRPYFLSSPPGSYSTPTEDKVQLLDFSGRRFGPPKEPGALWSLVEVDTQKTGTSTVAVAAHAASSSAADEAKR